MLVVMVFEFLVLFDMRPATNEFKSIGTTVFFGYLLMAALVQLIGLLLVKAGHYKAGGALQIIASAGHIIDLIGIIGIYGGLKAYRFTEAGEAAPSAA